MAHKLHRHPQLCEVHFQPSLRAGLETLGPPDKDWRPQLKYKLPGLSTLLAMAPRGHAGQQMLRLCQRRCGQWVLGLARMACVQPCKPRMNQTVSRQIRIPAETTTCIQRDGSALQCQANFRHHLELVKVSILQ